MVVFNGSVKGSVKNVGVEDTPRISEPLSFFEKTLFSSAPTGVSHRSFTVEHVYSFRSVLRTSGH